MFGGKSDAITNHFEQWHYRYLEPGAEQYRNNYLHLHAGCRAVRNNSKFDHYGEHTGYPNI